MKAVKKEKWHTDHMVKGRNEPCAIARVAHVVARVKGVSIETVREAYVRLCTRITITLLISTQGLGKFDKDVWAWSEVDLNRMDRAIDYRRKYRLVGADVCLSDREVSGLFYAIQHAKVKAELYVCQS